MKKSKKKGKRFQPYFAPSYVEVLAEDDGLGLIRLQIVRPIQYTGNSIRIYVKP